MTYIIDVKDGEKPLDFVEYLSGKGRLSFDESKVVKHEDIDSFIKKMGECEAKVMRWAPWPSEGIKNPSKIEGSSAPQTDAYAVLTFLNYEKAKQDEDIVSVSKKMPRELHYCIVPFSAFGMQAIKDLLYRLWALENLMGIECHAMDFYTPIF